MITPAQQTASFVAMQRRLGLASKRRRVPTPRYPELIESDFAARLVAMVDRWRTLTQPLVDALPEMLAAALRERADSGELARTQRIGLKIVVENPAGSVRTWTDADGTTGETVMKWPYGCIEDVRGADREDLDVYLGPLDEPEWVFIVHQQKKSADFATYDEDKVMLGWATADEAKAAYLEQYDDPRFFGGMTVMSRADFIAKLRAAGVELGPIDIGKITHEQRADVGEGRRSRVLLDLVRSDVSSAARSTEQTATQIAERTAQHQSKNLERQTKAGLGVAVPTRDRHLGAMIEHFAHENVSLIGSLGNKTLDGIEKLITRAFTEGKRHETLAAEIREQFAIAQRHARLIARDQIGKLNGQITRARHTELGIARFRWLTMRDPKVRERHRPMENRVFTYAGEGRPPFFPGQEILCRCQEAPLFVDIEAEINRILAAPTPLVEDLPAYAAERKRRAEASAAARAVAKEDLLAYAEHTKAAAAQAAAAQAAAAAELAARQAEAALAAKKAAAAAKSRATRAANKAKREAEQAAAALASPGSVRYASFEAREFVGVHGRGFVQDADAIEGGSVRVVKVNGASGEYYEAVFKVTSPYGDGARAYGTESSADWTFRQREVRNGELRDLSHTETMPNGARIRRGPGGTVEVGNAGALRNQVRIRATSLAELDKAMEDLSKHIGVDLRKQPSRADLELQTKARLAAKFDPKSFGSRMQSVTTPAKQREVIESIFDEQAKKHPVLLEALKDVQVKEVYPGHRTLYSESFGKHMAKQWGAMYHDGNPPAEIAAKIVGDTGLMSSVKRYNAGVFVTGMSTSADFRTGGADGVFMRVSKATPSSAGGNFRAVLDTKQVMGRLDWWAFNHDNYGRAGYQEYASRWSVPDQLAAKTASGSNEVMATHGVPPGAFKKFIVSDDAYRQRVLSELRKMGVTEINGKPIDEFVVTR